MVAADLNGVVYCIFFTEDQPGHCQFEVSWQKKIGGPVFASLSLGKDTLHGSLIFIGSVDNSMSAIKVFDGTTIWRIGTGGPIFSSPLPIGDMDVGSLKCGERTVPTTDVAEIKNISYTNAIVFGCHDGTLTMVDSHTGSVLWRLEIKDPIFSGAASAIVSSAIGHRRRVIVVCSTPGDVLLMTPDGSLVKKVRLSGELFSSPVFIPTKECNFVVGCRDNFMYCFSLR